jgi:hypothetical protein
LLVAASLSSLSCREEREGNLIVKNLPLKHQKSIVPQQRHASGTAGGRGGQFKPKPGKQVIGPLGIGSPEVIPSSSSAIR